MRKRLGAEKGRGLSNLKSFHQHELSSGDTKALERLPSRKPVGRLPRMWDPREIIEATQQGHQPCSTVGSCCWHPVAAQRMEQAGGGASREHCQRAREDTKWERSKRELAWKDNAPLSTVSSARTHKPGVPLRASLAKPGHMQNTQEIVTTSPPDPMPAHTPHSGKAGLCSQETKTNRWDLELQNTSKHISPTAI